MAQPPESTTGPHGQAPRPVLPDAALESPRPPADRMTFGVLLAHGPAKYQWRERAEMSYFMRLKVGGTEQQFWSPALRSAFARSHTQPQIGEVIGVRENSIQPVTAIFTERDRQGNVLRHRRYDTPRVHWVIERREFFDQRMAAAEAFRDVTLPARRAIEMHPVLLDAYLALDSARVVAARGVPKEQHQWFVNLFRAALAHAIERGESLPPIGLRLPESGRTRSDPAPER